MEFYKVDTEYFHKLASNNRDGYIAAFPFPHIVLDNVFPEYILNSILAEFPNSKQIDWIQYKNKNEVKFASRDENQFGTYTRYFVHVLNSRPFLKFLEDLTGIEHLIPDPDLEGGGLHQILRGGLLRIHADFNKHPGNNLDRRLNVLIYLNKDWKEEYGGCLELWNKNMDKAEIRILPLFNRMVIFSTTSQSYHGHPDPLNCPENMSRKSLAFYYYTNGRPQVEIDPEYEVHTTLFQKRKDKWQDAKHDVKQILYDFIPPVILRTYTQLKKKMFNKK